MIEARVTMKGGNATVELAGDLLGTDAKPLAELAAKLAGAKAVRFDLEHLGMMNSAGVMDWAGFLEKLPCPYVFVSCPVDFVDYANLVPQVIGEGRVETFYAPLRCSPCKVGQTTLLEAAKLTPESDFGSMACPKCGKAMEPEVEPADYFTFLFED